MKFTVSQTELQKALSVLHDILEHKLQSSVTQYIQITVKDGVARLTATDFVLTAHCEVEAEDTVDGQILVQSVKFAKAIKSLPQIPVHISTDSDSWVVITAGRSKFRIASVDMELFPSMPEPFPAQVQIPSKVFKLLLEYTRFATAKVLEVAQHYSPISCVRLKIANHSIEACSTDRRRLSYIRYDNVIDSDIELVVYIPHIAIYTLLKIAAYNPDTNISCGYNGKMFICQTKRVMLLTNMLQQQAFPDIDILLKKQLPHVVVYNLKEFKAVIERVAIMAEELPKVTLSISEQRTELNTCSPSFGDGFEVVTAGCATSSQEIAVNPFYVTDCLRNNTNAQTLVLQFSSPNDPIEITFNPVQNCIYRYILAPIQSE